MMCPKCRNQNVNVQVVTESQLKRKHHGIIWWLFIGWWWVIIKWTCYAPLALMAKIFAPKKMKIKSVHKSMAVCQNCGYRWEIKY